MKALFRCIPSVLVFVIVLSPLDGKRVPSRPHIFGIDRVQITVTNLEQAIPFYRAVTLDDCIHGVSRADMRAQNEGTNRGYTFAGKCDFQPENTFFVNCCQTISLLPMHDPAPTDLVDRITFATDNVHELRRYLMAQGLKPSKAQRPDTYLTIADPEGHLTAFVQRYSPLGGEPALPLPQLIHAGIVVHDRAAEDKFYKDILGFHVYWHGGMKDGEDNWVDMQVPDGSDWIEYMLGVSPDASHKTLGVMNHIALGVPDIHAAQQQLIKNGWKGTEEPKIGRDGKWQLNLYDPDETRVELMEFKPTKEPCCSAYTGPHPGPAQ
jgi:catechol 2,3-dioxygenase-like lactoylglutathione lyase family enzyme